MSAFAPISLDDVDSNPVVFNPGSIDSQGVAKLYESGAASFEARKSISLSVRPPKVGGSVARITAKVVIPLMFTDPQTGLLTKTGECLATVELVLPMKAPIEQRQNALVLAKGFLATPAVIAAVDNLESIY